MCAGLEYAFCLVISAPHDEAGKTLALVSRRATVSADIFNIVPMFSPANGTSVVVLVAVSDALTARDRKRQVSVTGSSHAERASTSVPISTVLLFRFGYLFVSFFP